MFDLRREKPEGDIVRLSGCAVAPGRGVRKGETIRNGPETQD